MKNYWNTKVFSLIFGILLIGFTIYALLDTFILTKNYETVETESSATAQASGDSSDESTNAQSTKSSSAKSKSNANSTSAINTDGAKVIGTYSDNGTEITVYQYCEYNTNIYVADVSASSASALQTALADNTYGKNVKEYTSTIASSCNAILAINGDYYGAQETGYVIRNGTLYRNTGSSDNEDLVIWADGSFSIVNEDDVTAEELLNEGAQQVLSFGPALLESGEISVTQNQEVGKAKTSNPRTAIGIIDDLHYVFIVADGRTNESSGLSLYQLASFIQEIGVQTAYNLDGGGSSTMVFNGTVINNPTTDGNTIKERKVSDIVYIGA